MKTLSPIRQASLMMIAFLGLIILPHIAQAQQCSSHRNNDYSRYEQDSRYRDRSDRYYNDQRRVDNYDRRYDYDEREYKSPPSKTKNIIAGTAIGAVGGAIIGGRKGTAIGAGVGAVTGYFIYRHKKNNYEKDNYPHRR